MLLLMPGEMRDDAVRYVFHDALPIPPFQASHWELDRQNVGLRVRLSHLRMHLLLAVLRLRA